jgi:hypothetical protein
MLGNLTTMMRLDTDLEDLSGPSGWLRSRRTTGRPPSTSRSDRATWAHSSGRSCEPGRDTELVGAFSCRHAGKF